MPLNAEWHGQVAVHRQQHVTPSDHQGQGARRDPRQVPGRHSVRGGGSGGQHLVNEGLSLVFVGVLSQGDLAAEDLEGLAQHALLAC